MMPLVVLPDTNALLHFKRPDQVNWMLVTGEGDTEVVLTVVPIREIEKHSNYHSVGRIRDRARSIKAWIRTLLQSDDHVRVDAREPTAFLADGLDPNILDDRLIATALMLRADGKDIAIYTDDTLLHAKAAGLSIRTIWPPESDRLKDEPDPVAAENARLVKELGAIKHRQPEPLFEWAGRSKLFSIKFGQPEKVEARTPAEERERLRPLMDYNQPTTTPTSLVDAIRFVNLGNLGAVQPSSGEVRSYNAALEKYHLHYESYFKRLSRHALERSRIAALEFAAGNTGRAPASSFRALVTLPDGMRALESEDSLGKPPSAPREPRKPGILGIIDDGRPGLSVASRLTMQQMIPNHYLDNSLSVDEKNNTIEFSVEKLVQHNPFAFSPVLVLVGQDWDGRNGSLSVRITAEELAEPIDISLPFSVVARLG